MDPAIKQGFAIGLIVAAVAGLVGWRQGWWPTPAVTAKLDAITPSAPEPAGKPPSPKSDRAAPVQSPASRDEGQGKPAPAAPGDVATLNPPSAPVAPQAVAPKSENGAFDVVRVEPSGESVVAGRCAANCVVELTANGKTHAKTVADAAGAWVMTPPLLPPGDHQLGLKITRADGQVAISEQSVTVSVPDSPKGEVVVVLNEPNAPSKILQSPGPAAGASTQAKAAPEGPTPSAPPARAIAVVSIAAVDAEKGRLFVQGAAPAGATLRVYLNNALIAQPVSGRDERWSIRVERGLAPGDYVARVDHVETPSGKVVARAEARFAYEGEVAEAAPRQDPLPPAGKPAALPDRAGQDAPAPAAQAPSPPAEGKTTTFAPPPQADRFEALPVPPKVDEAASPVPVEPAARDAANPVVPSIDTARVQRGDSLWRISRKTYGSGSRYTVIFTANDNQIRNPALIHPGQVLVLPDDPAKAASSTRPAPAQ